MTTTFTRTAKADNEITVSFEVRDRRLSKEVLDIFRKLNLTDDVDNGDLDVRYSRSLSVDTNKAKLMHPGAPRGTFSRPPEHGRVKFNVMKDHDKYEPCVSEEARKLLASLFNLAEFDLTEGMETLDNPK